jgi:hypothetical protein
VQLGRRRDGEAHPGNGAAAEVWQG